MLKRLKSIVQTRTIYEYITLQYSAVQQRSYPIIKPTRDPNGNLGTRTGVIIVAHPQENIIKTLSFTILDVGRPIYGLRNVPT